MPNGYSKYALKNNKFAIGLNGDDPYKRLKTPDLNASTLGDALGATTPSVLTYAAWAENGNTQPTKPNSSAVTVPTTTPTTYGASITSSANNQYVAPMSSGESDETSAPVTGNETSATADAVGLEYEKYLLDQKDNAYKKAESEYEASFTDAERAYQRFINPYGVEQETISDSGLAGSGYAKYLNERAYAAKVAAQQAALGRKADAELVADTAYNDKYSEYLLTKKANDAQIEDDLKALYDYGVDATIDGINALVESGTLSETEKAARIDDYVKSQEANLANGSIFTESDGSMTSYNGAKEIVTSAERLYGKDSQQYKDAVRSFDDTYGVKTIHGFGDPNQKQLGVDATEFGRAGVGDKINVWWGEGKYKVRKGEKVTDPDVIAAARNTNFPEGASVFGMNGQIYIHYNGDIYSVDEKNGKAYEALNSLLFGDGERIFVQGSGLGKYKDQNGKTYTEKQEGSTTSQNPKTYYVDENGKRYNLNRKKGRLELVPQ